MKKFFKELFCVHEYEMDKSTCRLIRCGMSKGAEFKCKKCGKTIFSDIFSRRVNR